MREVAAARCLDADELHCRVFTVAYLQGEAGRVGSLAGVDEKAERRATLFWELFRVAEQRQGVADWRRFFTVWQSVLAVAPPSRPLYRNLTATHGLIADRLEQLADPGDQWRTILLACAGCGYVFEIRRHAGQYRRTCGECHGAWGGELLRRAHPRGRGLQAGGSVYRRWRDGDPVSRVAVVSVECAEPGCGRPFLTTKTNQNYCEEHRSPAFQQRRHRGRARAA